MQTTWEKAIQNIEIYIGQDTSKELQTRMLILIPDPTHSQEMLDRHTWKFQLRSTTNIRLL